MVVEVADLGGREHVERVSFQHQVSQPLSAGGVRAFNVPELFELGSVVGVRVDVSVGDVDPLHFHGSGDDGFCEHVIPRECRPVEQFEGFVFVR